MKHLRKPLVIRDFFCIDLVLKNAATVHFQNLSSYAHVGCLDQILRAIKVSTHSFSHGSNKSWPLTIITISVNIPEYLVVFRVALVLW